MKISRRVCMRVARTQRLSQGATAKIDIAAAWFAYNQSVSLGSAKKTHTVCRQKHGVTASSGEAGVSLNGEAGDEYAEIIRLIMY